MENLDSDELLRVSGGRGNFVAGDSIALGTAQALGWAHNARVGAPSHEIISKVPTDTFNSLVLSAGSNDPTNPGLRSNLMAMRRKAGGGSHVIWIEPVDPRARAVVDSVAHANGDRTVSFTPGKDHVHPRSYGELARKIHAMGY